MTTTLLDRKGIVLRILALALIGLLMAIADIVYWDYADSHHIATPNSLFLLSHFLDPPSFLLMAFIDIVPTKTQLVATQCAVLLLNGGLYASVGALVLRKRGRSQKAI